MPQFGGSVLGKTTRSHAGQALGSEDLGVVAMLACRGAQGAQGVCVPDLQACSIAWSDAESAEQRGRDAGEPARTDRAFVLWLPNSNGRARYQRARNMPKEAMRSVQAPETED